MSTLDIKDFIGIAISGILGILWWDIRGIRNEREAHKTKIDEKFKGYLKEEKHELLCENATLRFEAKVDNMKNEILEAIKNNHK